MTITNFLGKEHEEEVVAAYQLAQNYSESAGTDYLIPATMFVALIEHMGPREWMGESWPSWESVRQELIDKASDAEAAMAEALYAKEIMKQAISHANYLNHETVGLRDVALALLVSRPPSVRGVLEKHHVDVEGMIRRLEG